MTPTPAKAVAAAPVDAGGRAHYSGKMPRAHKVVSYGEKKRHWARVIVVLVVLAAIIAGIIWLLAPMIRGISRSSRLERPAQQRVVARHAPVNPSAYLEAQRLG